MAIGINSVDHILSVSSNLIRWLSVWSWQALVVIVIAWAALKLDRSRNATIRYRIWLTAFLAAAMLPLLSAISQGLRLPSPPSSVQWPVGDLGHLATPDLPQAADGPAFPLPPLMWPVLCAMWAAGASVSLLRLGNSLWKLHRVRCGARPVSAADLHFTSSGVLPSDLAAARVALSAAVDCPGIVGLLRPLVLLPADIISWTSPEERISILRHELAHIGRHDHVVNLFQSVLKALLFYHPMVRYACRQLSMEREYACDDQVLDLGTPPQAYAESILKAVERSFLADPIHQAASFASRRKLERRIDMIMDSKRVRRPLRQWQFLVLPLALIATITWLVIPGASSQPSIQLGRVHLAPQESGPAPSASPVLQKTQSVPIVDKTTIWVDVVKRGRLVRQVRGLGIVRPGSGDHLKAEIKIPAPMAKDVRVGQPASIDTRNGVVSGRVTNIGSAAADGIIPIDVSMEGSLPDSVRTGLEVDGTIQIEQLDDVLYVGRPAKGQSNSIVNLFKLGGDGKTATRVQVRLGKSSVNTIQILDGLQTGDKVILSDMTAYETAESIQLK